MKPQPHGASASSANPNGLPKFNLFMVLSALRCWWHIALPLGLVLGACAAVAVFYTTKPTYTAEVWLLIHERPMRLLPGGVQDDPRKFVANQIELMRSPPVLDPVIAIREVRAAPELVDEEDPSLYLRKNLQIRAQGGSDYFVVGFTSEDPVKAARIANEVAQSYLALQDAHDSKVYLRMLETLQSFEKARQRQIGDIKRRLDDWTTKLGGKDAFALQRGEPKQQVRTKRQELEKQLIDLEFEQLTVDAELSAERELYAAESFVPPDELVTAQVNGNEQLAELHKQLAADREKLELHKKRSVDLSKNVPYQQLEQKVQEDEESLNRFVQELRESTAAQMQARARAKREAQIAELEAALVRVEGKIRRLQGRLALEEEEQSELSFDMLQLQLDWREHDRASIMLDRISDQIAAMQTEREAPERVTMFQAATVPVRPDEEVPYKKMLMAALAALALPFGAAVGIEILFGRVGSRQQLETSGGIMVVGEITTLPRRIKSRRQESEPQREVQLYEESINGLRTYLTLIESARGRRVLAVTSSISREGKTSLAAQLAVSVANSSGKPTLLIDGDMRSPDLHRIFDVDCGPGLADVLAGKCPVEEVIETSFSDRLHVLTAGHLTVNPHQLTGSGEFERLIEKLRGLYDHIIIDTPPILPASEALLMARASDAAILCVRRDYSRVDQVSEAHTRLVAAGVKVAGAVLNGVPSQAYAFRYGSYYYSKARPSGPETDASGEPTIVA